MKEKRLQEMRALLMDINKVREHCNELFREMVIDHALHYTEEQKQ